MFHKYLVLLFGVFLLRVPASSTEDDMSEQSYSSICPEDVVTMFPGEEIPSQSGPELFMVVHLQKWSGIPAVVLNVTVDTDSDIYVNQHAGSILYRNTRSFSLKTYYPPPKTNQLEFGIYAKLGAKIPNLVSLYLNDEYICPILNKTVEKCGKRMIKHEGLITFGGGTRPGDFPWHSAIYHRNGIQRNYKCGGSIITSFTILTAAHCVFESFSLIAAERIIVQIEKYNFHVADDFTRERQVFRVIPYPTYNSSLLTDDIALLLLSREIIFSDYIQPICLWDPNKKLARNNVGVAIGWGHTENGRLADTLRFVELPIVPTLTCLTSDRDFFGTFLTDNNFCAGYLNGTNVCSGDSGGSLLFEDEDKVWRIRGIVSLSIRREDSEICNPKHYVIFTDVAKFLPWILQESS